MNENICIKCQLQDCGKCDHRPKGKCGKVTEVFSRVSGYFRPVKNWNIGKREEFRERKMFKV